MASVATIVLAFDSANERVVLTEDISHMTEGKVPYAKETIAAFETEPSFVGSKVTVSEEGLAEALQRFGA